MPEPTSLVQRVLRHQLLWPVLALFVLLLVNVVAKPSFLDVRMQDGHLYGNLVDIVRNSAPVMLVALGMTLVIATRGIDIGAKAQIQAKVAELAAEGLSVVFISGELEEVLRVSDRLVVMRDRRKIDERPNHDVSVSDVLEIIAGEARAEGDTDA